jgi:hypothetical protein
MVGFGVDRSSAGSSTSTRRQPESLVRHHVRVLEPTGSALIAHKLQTDQGMFLAIRWVLQLAAWALAALFIAGFTGIVRKT